jgi:predicted O-methyltransferase YrrM
MFSNNIEIIIPTEEENKIIHSLDSSVAEVSQMTSHEREFINALVLRNRPKKLLEIGVSAGSSSIIILNAIKNIEDTMLYSIDYSNNWYKSPDKRTGFYVDNYKGLKNRWKLFTGALSFKFMDIIGNNIDFCLIDTVHTNPGGILDILMVLPYLDENATIVFHDIGWHTWNYPSSQWDITNSLLMSTIYGKKYIQGNFSKDDENLGRKTFFPNIGGIKLNKNSFSQIYEILNLLTLKWDYFPQEEELNELLQFFKKHYDRMYIEYLMDINTYQKKCNSIEPK